MIRFAAAISCLAMVQSAAAQELFDLPLVAPCTQAESQAEVAPALLEAGWSPVAMVSDTGQTIITAAPQGVTAATRLQDAFADAAEVEAFVTEASEPWLYFAEAIPELYATFERDGIGLLIQHGRDWSDRDLVCIFVAQDFPLVEDLLAEAVDIEIGAVRLRSARMERFGRSPDSVSVVELTAPEAALPLLTGRYSILVEHFYAADQLPDSE